MPCCFQINDKMQNLKQISKHIADGKKIAMLTAYDASMAALAEAAGVDCILVGDSLGMVIQGERDTLSVSVEDMVYHTKLVRQGAPHTFIIADMPFMSSASRERTLDCAHRLMQSGADMVKLEGGNNRNLEAITTLREAAVPVCGHLGLLPTHLRQNGVYARVGAEKTEHANTIAQSHDILNAGAQMLVLECTTTDLTEKICDVWRNKGCTIGIGSGNATDGQVLVCYDALGVSSYPPSFAYDFLAESNSVQEAFIAYAHAVHSGKFPPKHSK